MTIRKTVRKFAALGPLSGEDAEEDVIALHQAALQDIVSPVSTEEAQLLMTCFCEGDCYGLCWTLLHLVESAPPEAELQVRPGPAENEWMHRLWDRAHR